MGASRCQGSDKICSSGPFPRIGKWTFIWLVKMKPNQANLVKDRQSQVCPSCVLLYSWFQGWVKDW